MMREGRLVEAVRIPPDLFDQLQCEAARRGQPVGRVAGDLIAEVLPGALAEAAADLLRRGAESEKSLNDKSLLELVSQQALSGTSVLLPSTAIVPLFVSSGPECGDGIVG
jgi:hypothetical protein